MEQVGDIVTAEIIDIGDKLVLGACEDGRKLWLNGPAVPGDKVEAQVDTVHKNFTRGSVTRILSPLKTRLEAPCPHFNHCPGCLLQPLPYAQECELKSKKIKDALQRIGKIDAMDWRDLQPAANDYGYRNKVEFTVHGHSIGYHHEDQLIDITNCLLAEEVLRKVYCMLRELIQKELPYSHNLNRMTLRSNVDQQCVLLLHGDLAPVELECFRDFCEDTPALVGAALQRRRGRPWHLLYGTGELTENLADVRHRVPFDAFFQINRAQANCLVDTTMQWAREEPVDTAVDLFCGLGAFTFPLSRFARHVIGVDASSSPLLAAKRRDSQAGDVYVHFVQHDLSKGLPSKLPCNHTVDLLVLDPPRTGLKPRLISDIVSRLQPRRILYVSCNPSTLARDCASLNEQGGYRLTRATGFDLFPRTSHVEALVLLVRD